MKRPKKTKKANLENLLLATRQAEHLSKLARGDMLEHGGETLRKSSKTLAMCRALAEQGDPEAQFCLGFMHYTGTGAPRDFSKALKWFGKAAAQGNPDAQLNLGIMHHSGEGTPQDLRQAF